MISKVNSKTHKEIVSKLGISKGTVYRIITKTLEARLRKKCKVHQLDMAQIKKRRARSWRWNNYVTSDEAMIYLRGSFGRRRVYFLRKCEDPADKLKFVKKDSFAAGFIALTGVSYRGITEIRNIDKGTKINNKNYIDKILKPFLKDGVPRHLGMKKYGLPLGQRMQLYFKTHPAVPKGETSELCKA